MADVAKRMATFLAEFEDKTAWDVEPYFDTKANVQVEEVDIEGARQALYENTGRERYNVSTGVEEN